MWLRDQGTDAGTEVRLHGSILRGSVPLPVRPRNECDSALRDMGPDLVLQNGNKRAMDGDKP